MLSSVTSSYMAGHRAVTASIPPFTGSRLIWYDATSSVSWPGGLGSGSFNNLGSMSGIGSMSGAPAPTVITTAPKMGGGTIKAVSSSSNNSFVQTPNSPTAVTGYQAGNTTLSMWAYYTAANTSNAVTFTPQYTGGYSLTIGSVSMNLLGATGTFSVSTSTPVPLNTWVMLTLMPSQSTTVPLQLYLNDTLAVSQTAPSDGTPTSVFGVRFYPGTVTATTYTNDFQIFNYRLTLSDIQSLYASTKSKYGL